MFDAIDTVSLCLTTFTPMHRHHAGAAREHAGGGGRRLHQRHRLRRLPHQEGDALPGCLQAHRHAWWPTASTITPPWSTLPLETFRQHSPLFEEDIYQAIDLLRCCEGRTSYGGPSKAGVQGQLQKARQEMEAIQKSLEGEDDPHPAESDTEEEDHP